MTIARRLIILAAVPLVVLLGLGFLSWNQLARVETRTRYALNCRFKVSRRWGTFRGN